MSEKQIQYESCPIVIVLGLVELGYFFIFLVHDLEWLFLHTTNNDVVKKYLYEFFVYMVIGFAYIHDLKK